MNRYNDIQDIDLYADTKVDQRREDWLRSNPSPRSRLLVDSETSYNNQSYNDLYDDMSLCSSSQTSLRREEDVDADMDKFLFCKTARKINNSFRKTYDQIALKTIPYDDRKYSPVDRMLLRTKRVYDGLVMGFHKEHKDVSSPRGKVFGF